MFGCSCRCILLLVFLHSVHSFKWISPTHLDKSYIFSSSVSLRLKASSVKISNDKPRGGPPLPPSPSSPSNVTVNVGKALTKEIMAHFGDSRGLADIKRDVLFKKRLYEAEVSGQLDGMHVMTLIFQSARSRRKIKSLMPPEIVLKTLSNWEREWSERDISTFVYGIRALECVNKAETELLRLGAKKISESSASLSSRAIGNSLYGLQDITSDTLGAAELCAALALKIEDFSGDLLGQDIGIGMYGLQGMSSDVPEVRQLVAVLAQKIKQSEIELDAQALGNTLYGLQSMSSAHAEVLALVSAIATKVSESRPELGAQAIGSALYGLQRLSCDALEVRTLVAALAEKVELSTEALDAQAIGNALFGLQSMKSTYAEVRSLVQAIAKKLVMVDTPMDSKGIGSALYGLNSMTSEEPQVRALMAALAVSIDQSKCVLTGQGIADALYGLSGMTYDCPELRAVLKALSNRIDGQRGKLDAQEIGNALFGLSGMSSEMPEVRLIVSKLVGKLSRSKAILRSQHIGRALLGLQRFTADAYEVRLLLRQLVARIRESDRTRMTSQAIGDALYGIQGMSSDVDEVQQLVGELAKKIATTAAVLTPRDIGRALFGLQGLSSSSPLFAESVIGLDADEVQFLMSALWDKIKVNTAASFPLSSIAMGLQGLMLLKDPIAENIRQFLHMKVISMNAETVLDGGSTASAPSEADKIDIVYAVRALRLNNMLVPKWLAIAYNKIEETHSSKPIIAQSRGDRMLASRFASSHPTIPLKANALIDGFRLDMCFPELKLNIELDGPSHGYPARARFDKERDAFLKEKKDYEVVRVSLVGKSSNEAIAAIHNIVMDRMDRKAEQDIQRLYSKDEAIQQLYQKKGGAE